MQVNRLAFFVKQYFKSNVIVMTWSKGGAFAQRLVHTIRLDHRELRCVQSGDHRRRLHGRVRLASAQSGSLARDCAHVARLARECRALSNTALAKRQA